MDADVCLWHKGDIQLRHIKRLLTGAERTSHKHPFKQCEAAVRQGRFRHPPGVGQGCQAVGRQSHWGVQTSEPFIEKNLKESAMPFLSFSCINAICRKPISTSSDALRNIDREKTKRRTGAKAQSAARSRSILLS